MQWGCYHQAINHLPPPAFFSLALSYPLGMAAIAHIYFSQTLFNSLPLAIQNFTAVRNLCPTERKEVDTCRERESVGEEDRLVSWSHVGAEMTLLC